MPKFLDTEKVLSTLLSENPDGLYPIDRADNADPTKRSNASGEYRSWAMMLDAVYTNLENIYFNKFISTADLGGIARFEKDFFPIPQDATQTLEQRRANLLAQFRKQGSISFAGINAIIDAILTTLGFAYELQPYCGHNGGGWIMDVSKIDVDTILAPMDPLEGAIVTDPLTCSLDYAGAGITEEQLDDIQETAYTYAVRIFGVPDNATLNKLDYFLTIFEPARSTHFVLPDWYGTQDDFIHGGFFNTTTYFDQILCGDFGPSGNYDVIDGGTW